MGFPGVSAGLLGAGGSGGAGGVTPGAGSAGFTPTHIIVADAAGALNDGPEPVYRFSDATGLLLVELDQLAAAAPTVASQYPRARTAVGEAGGFFSVGGGGAGPASAVVAGGVGGTGGVFGGSGGAGSAAQPAGAGGVARVLGGLPGPDAGGGGAAGGSVFVLPAAGTGAGVDGDVVIGDDGTLLAGYATRYVRVGPAGGSIPLLGNVAAPVGAELVNLNGGTNALALVGQTAVGSWIAAGEVNIAPYANRASATGYIIRANATNTLLNAPAGAGQVFLQLGGSFAQGWTVGDGLGTAHVLPLTTAAFDFGSPALKGRDLHLSRDAYVGDDVEMLTGVSHDVYVAPSAGGLGTLNVFAADGLTSAPGSALVLRGGDAASTGAGDNRAGGDATLRGGNAGGDGGDGGAVHVYGGTGNDTVGTVYLGVTHACDVVVGAPTSLLTLYGGTPVAQQTGVAVTAAAIHAALVALGAFTA